MGRRLLLLTEDVEQLKDEIAGLQVGDRFTFGDYHGPIEWRVLEKSYGNLTVISEHALDCKPFDEEYGEYGDDWDSSSLKKWLNSEFFNKAFNSEEKSLIENTSVGKVFLLSIEEAMDYFSSNNDIRCRPTNYANSQAAEPSKNFCEWWLRSKGDVEFSIACVTSEGSFDLRDYYLDDFFFVRPAMVLSISDQLELRF